MLKVINPDLDNPHQHDHDHDHDHDDDDEDEEAEPEFNESLHESDEDPCIIEEEEKKEMLMKYKVDREVALKKKSVGCFDTLYRSKGFFWLATRPTHFFEWQ